MRYEVYGLRLKGDRETRYVGMTRRGNDYRLKRHFYAAKPRKDNLANWINANRADIEIFTIAETDDREVAKAAEKTIVTVALGLGQRLFNVSHTPAANRSRKSALFSELMGGPGPAGGLTAPRSRPSSLVEGQEIAPHGGRAL
jgi:hypothetical protein